MRIINTFKVGFGIVRSLDGPYHLPGDPFNSPVFEALGALRTYQVNQESLGEFDRFEDAKRAAEEHYKGALNWGFGYGPVPTWKASYILPDTDEQDAGEYIIAIRTNVINEDDE